MENNPYEVDVKTIQSFKTEDYTEYEKMFKSMDTDKSGLLHREGRTPQSDAQLRIQING